MTELDEATLAALAVEAERFGLLGLGAVALDDPGFEPARAALADYLDRGLEGEMAFMRRTRAVRMHPEGMLPGARSAVVALVPYRGEAGPLARYLQSADYHTEVHRRLQRLADALAERVPGVESLICVDTKPVLERAAGALAGLGFLGKNGCLIAPGLGSYVVLGLLLTTARWSGRPVDRPALPWDACGSCRRCLDACPTDAFEGPGRLDPRRCIAYLTIEHRGPIADELRGDVGPRIAGCDVCQEVCPYNRSEQREARVPDGAWLPPAGSGPSRVVDLPRLVGIGTNQYRQFIKGTALNRIPKRAMHRNAIVAIANGEGPLDAAEREALEAVVDGAEAGPPGELVELAKWALARRGGPQTSIA